MASTPCVSRALAILAEMFPRDLSPELVKIYQSALADVPDDDLMRAVRKAIDECRFFPVVAELKGFIGANAAPFVDVEPILARIRGMCSYLPTCGEIYPAVEAVRHALGEAIAAAYGLAGGGSRLFSSNETTRSIAQREFSQEIGHAARAHGVQALALPPLVALPSPSLVIYGDRRDRGAFRLLSSAGLKP